MSGILAPFAGMGFRKAASCRAWYDHILVGAGTAGSVLASRLAGKGSKVLLLEATSVQDGSSWLPHVLGGAVFGGRAGATNTVWARGHDADYERWAEATHDPVWRRGRLEAQFQRGESRLPALGARDGEALHAQAFLKACAELGLAEDVGLAVGDRAEGVGLFRRVKCQRAPRWARSAYLSPTMLASGADGQQLEVMSGVRVQRVRINNGRAVGVEWEGGAADAGEVVLCAGTLGSPELLLSSGIGPRAALEARGAGVVRDLPGVGANYQDHVGFVVPPLPEEQQHSWHFPNIAGRILHPHDDVVSDLVAGGYIKSEASAPREDLHLSMLPDGAGGPRLGVWLAAPRSRGRLAPSAADPRGQALSVKFDPLADERDRHALVCGLRHAYEILSAPSFARVSGAAGSVAASANKALQSEPEALEFLRRNCAPAGHPAGTCAMGSGEDAVVDGQLQVHGVQGLRVADASVMPSIVTADPHGSVVAIAEVAAKVLADRMASYNGSQYGIPPVAISSAGPVHAW